MNIIESDINKILNPAYSAFLIAHFMNSYAKKTQTPLNSSYLFIILPFCIYPEYKKLIRENRSSNFLLLIEKNKILFNNFNQVFHYFVPHTYEGIYFLTKIKSIECLNSHLKLTPRLIKFSKYNKNIKYEVGTAKKLGSFLGDSVDIITIFSSLGVEL